ncbi:MAG: four helix bundle protein [Chloroflexota bacterium]
MSELSLEEWLKTVPEKVRSDPLWGSTYYRMAMYLYELAWKDCELLQKDFRGREIVHQLVRSAGSICANIEEAYGRGVGSADYLRIMRIALGEVRETQGWFFRSRQILPADLIQRRSDLLAQIVAMLASTISSHRQNLSKR